MRAHESSLFTNRIAASLQKLGPCVVNTRTLSQILRENRLSWNVPELDVEEFARRASKVIATIQLQQLGPYPDADLVRFAWGAFAPEQVALSARPNSYISHGSAAYLHGLISQPDEIHVNYEQSPKPIPDKSRRLDQGSVDRAFSSAQRQSKMRYFHDRFVTVIVNGKATGGLGVGLHRLSNGVEVRCTNLERTLVDIAVRPQYAGGVKTAAEAYRRAVGRTSFQNLLLCLQRLDYMYPYHQSIGFYLERSGVPDAELRSFQKLGLHVDFYLDYGLPNLRYDERWRIYYPADL